MAAQDTDPLTYLLIGLGMATHSELGPGLEEICYHESLSTKMCSKSVSHEFKPRRELIHRGFVADRFEADLVVSNRVVVEAKHLRDGFVAKHFAQLHCYLKAWNIQVGLLFDFGKQSLIFCRRILSRRHSSFPCVQELDRHLRSQGLGAPDAQLLAASLDRILQEHGLGYWDTTYRGLLRAELQAEHLDVIDRPEVAVDTGRGQPRRVPLGCLVTDRRLVLQVLALQQSIPAAAEAVMATYLRCLGLHTGVTVNFGKEHLDLDVRRR